MRGLITFCVLFLFSTLTDTIPLLPEHLKEHPKANQPSPNTQNSPGSILSAGSALPNQHQLANLPSNYQQVRQLMESNPKLKEVISTVKNKKRYLVVHPDGRVEHVDNLEPIAQKHPNHILINADTLRNHVPWRDNYPVGTTIANAPPISTPPKPNAAPAVATAVTSTATATTVTSTGPINKPQLKPHIPHDIKTPATSSLTKNLPVGTSINNAPPVSIPAKRSAPAVATAAALTVTATKVTSPGPILKPHLKPHFPHEPTSTASTASTSAATVIKTSANSSPSKTSITPEIKKAVPSKSTSAVVAPVTPVPTITNIPVAVIPHVAASPYKTPDPPISSMIDGTADNLHAVTIAANTPIVHPSPVPASTPISNTHVNSLTNTVSPITTLKSFDTLALTAEPSQTSSVVKVPVEPIPNESAMVSQSDSSTSASLPSDVTSKTDSSTSIVNSDCSVDASSNVPTSETVDDSSNIDEPCSINEDYSKEASSYSTEGTSAETLCEDSDDITDYDLDDIQSDHSIGKPVVWCESTDLDFWDKILGNETYNVIYFINVPHEPIIEKDTKTTIYSNGTILEEITETKRDSESDEPIVTKTVRLIDPNEL